MGGVVQRWLLIGAVVAAAVAALKIQSQAADIADLKLIAATEKADRELAARNYERQLSKREIEHATEQQTQEDYYVAATKNHAAAIARGLADNKRLRDELTKATTRDRPRDTTDSVACERLADRHEELGGLAGEGTELLQEARNLLQERDIDIQRLWGQIKNDRKACGHPVN